MTSNKAYRVSSYIPGETISIDCAVCNTATETRLVKTENNLNIVACRECGFIFCNPRPTEQELFRFYQEYYPETSDIPESWNREMGDIFDESRNLVFRHKPAGRLLDVGCSFGFFLKDIPSENWEKHGVEPSETATDYLSRHFPDVRVTTGAFEEVDYPEAHFDVITSFYVLEHVLDPRAFMEKVFALLKSEGIAVIRIPYSKPFLAINKLLGRPFLQAPMHLSDFSPRHMEAMSRDIGFSEVKAFHRAHRYSTDFVEKAGATVMSSIGRTVEYLSQGKLDFPFYGAYSYFLRKG